MVDMPCLVGGRGKVTCCGRTVLCSGTFLAGISFDFADEIGTDGLGGIGILRGVAPKSSSVKGDEVFRENFCLPSLSESRFIYSSPLLYIV